MSGLVPQDPHTFGFRSALDLQHLFALEAGQPRVRKVERDRNPRYAIRCEPFIREPEVWPESNPARGQFVAQVGNPIGQGAVFNR